MEKKVNRYRDETLLIMVTSKEKEQIRKNMNTAGYKTISNYMRKMALNGRVINIDFTSLKESLNETGKYVYELNRIGNNLNQIAHKLNQTDIVENEDIKFLIDEFNKIQKNYQLSQDILIQEINILTRND